MVKCAWVCVYAPMNEKGMKGRMKVEKFREDLGQVLKMFKNVRRVFLFGDMNARVGSTEIGGVVGKYGVEGVNENGQYLVDICAERDIWARGNERSLILYSCGQQVEEGGGRRQGCKRNVQWLGPFCSCSESKDEREVGV